LSRARRPPGLPPRPYTTLFRSPPPQPPVTQSPAEGGGCGCWIPALITSFVVFVLIIVGLFLPPVDLWNRLFGTQYAVLNADANRSEEHTSELQSRENLVCRLLL